VKFRFPLSMGALAGSYQTVVDRRARERLGHEPVQHGDRIFAVLFVYDITGKPTWYVMSGGEWDSGAVVHRPLYSPRGSPFFRVRRLALRRRVNRSARSRITFQRRQRGDARLHRSTASPAASSSRASRSAPPGRALMANAGDMYWGGPSQNGWGVAALQQYTDFFIVWFTYDAAGCPVWYVLPSSSPDHAHTYEGRIYRTTGSAWVGEEYRASQLQVIDVGPFRLRFTNGEPSALEYTVESRTGTLPLARQGF
jgi:hypothetical protein